MPSGPRTRRGQRTRATASSTTAVTRNQRAGGGFWQYLGSYSFDPLLNPSITLAANDNGSVAADVVRFVGGPAGAADVAYLHTDHLGTPQAMTDAGAQLLWWRDQTPFGQTVDTGGFSQTPIRFPGQFADDESGLHYNYFRDYDPALGRYIQSDPIGLRGGLNTYLYANANPVRYTDPTGEAALELALTSAVTAAAADGPLPIGDVVAVGIMGAWLIHHMCTTDDAQPSKADCNKAKKLLKQAVRLSDKQGIRLPENRKRELREKIRNKTVTSSDLPGTMQNEFPPSLRGKTLAEIERICG